jgi:crotonobetainyl-CoA:carnitine CoA-transferase CaiB-like acyl-CoA transferase
MQALEGIRIADVSGSIATSYAAKLFADYGAQVFNLEPEAGFPTRKVAPFVPGTDESAMHGYLHANKLSVRGGELGDGGSVDLVIYDPTVSHVGECAASTSAISWFGKSGPYADHNGSDAVIHALIGQLRGIGRAEGPPLIPTGYEAQMIGGVTAYVGSLGHLLGIQMGNSERFDLDTSIFEAAMCLTDVAIIHAQGQAQVAPRLGINTFAPTYPLGIFPCKDGWLGVTVLSPSQWQAFCVLLGMDEFANVPLFQASMSRLESIDVIEPVMTERLLQYSAEELFYRGQAMRVPLARVPTMNELFHVDQFVERNAFSAVDHAGKQYQVPTTPFRLFETPPHFGGSVASLGEHNAVWEELSGGGS